MLFLKQFPKVLLALIIFSTVPHLYAQDVNVSVGSSRTQIPPYIRDLESALDLFVIDLSCNFQQPTQVNLVLELTEDNLGRIAFGQSDILFIPNAPFQQLISNTEFTQWNNWEYDEGMKQQLLQTGRLPDGVYNLCVEVVPIDNPMPLDEFCYLFEIFLPQNVQLIQPDNGEQTIEESPIFQWTPIPWSQPVNYQIQVFRMIAGQAPQDAVASNQPQHEELVLGQTTLLYPQSALPLETGNTYAWWVIAKDEFDNTVGENNGQSEVYSFTHIGNGGNVGNGGVGGNGGNGGGPDWRDSLKIYTAPGYMQTVTLNNDPCPSIQDLINSIQRKLVAARAAHQKGAVKKAEGEEQSKNGKEAAEEAAAKIPDVKKALANAKQQRDILLGKANKDNGAKIVKPDAPCSGGALIRAGNGGSLKLDPGTALCIPPGKTDAWLKSFNAIRKDYEFYTKKMAHHTNELSALEAKKAKGEKDQTDGDQKAKDGQSDMDAAAKDIAELEQALTDLIPLAKECGDVIKNLKEAAAKATKAIVDASKEIINGQDQNHKPGSKAKELVGGARDSLTKAQEAYKKGDYAAATNLANKAGLEARKSKVAKEREDCYKKAAAKVGKAKYDLAERKKLHPKSDYSGAEKSLGFAQKALDEMKQAIADGKFGLADILCKRVFQIIDNEFYPPLLAITCNEGAVLIGRQNFITEYKAGYMYMTTQLEPGNVGYEVKKMMEVLKDPLGIADMVDNIYKLTSIGHAYDIYSIWIKNYGIYDMKCKDGVWVSQNVRGIYRKVYLKLEQEAVPGKEVSKIMLKGNYEKVKSSFTDMVIDDIIETVNKAL